MRTLATLSFMACLPASGQQGGETDRWAAPVITWSRNHS